MLSSLLQYDVAIEDLIRCTALARIVYGDCHWRFAEVESELAQAYWKYKNLPAQAQQHAEEARNIMLRVVQSGPSQEERKHIYRFVSERGYIYGICLFRVF